MVITSRNLRRNAPREKNFKAENKGGFSIGRFGTLFFCHLIQNFPPFRQLLKSSSSASIRALFMFDIPVEFHLETFTSQTYCTVVVQAKLPIKNHQIAFFSQNL